ncbi:hypothetical protein LPYR103PRE_23130 [Segatella asaccharophila]|jgi:serine/threonine protein phosphatase PrpC
MEIYQYTNKGQRKENQDYTVYKVLPSGDSIFVVADGMGGYSCGDVASHVVGDAIVSYVEANIDKYTPQTLLENAIKGANEVLQQKSLFLNVSKMGTVVSVAMIIGGEVYITWLGDSRVYLFDGDNMVFKTEDHSLLNEIKTKRPLSASTIERYAGVVTRCIMGNDDLGEIPVKVIPICKGETIVLCTDGFHKEMDIQWALKYNSALKETLDAKSNKASDNYSFIKVTI